MKLVLSHLYQLEPLHVLGFVAAMNFLSFFMFWFDKRMAMKGGYRIPEVSLLIISLFGGSPAAWFAQRRFNHKISKPVFRQRFWTIILFQIVAISYLWYVGFLAAWLVPYNSSEQPVQQPSEDKVINGVINPGAP